MPTTENILTEVRQRIRGPEPALFIDAPAGHGKTYEAVRAAVDLSEALSEFERVLVLTHTNAARDAFKSALGAMSGGVVFKTLDSFALALVETYGPMLEAPTPLYPEQEGHPSFTEVRERALDLLDRAPPIAEAIALRHPVVMVDEHQDSTLVQQELLTCIAEARTIRLRYFGDEMQAIFDYDENLVDWSSLCKSGEVLGLPHGYRWRHDPDLRDFLARARTALEQGQPVDLRDAPESVKVRCYPGKAPGPGQARTVPDECATALWALRDTSQLAVLVHPNLHARAIGERIPHLSLHEGMQPDGPKGLLEAALDASGDAVRLSLSLIDALRACGSGIDSVQREQLKDACQPEGIELGRKKRIAPIAGIVERLYEQPDVATWLYCLRMSCEQASSIQWKPQLEDSLSLLTAIRIEKDDEALQALYETAGARRHTLRLAPRIVTTIHKAKGREFRHVALPFVSATEFPDNHAGRRRFYVALTRVSKRLELMIPEENPSPLVLT